MFFLKRQLKKLGRRAGASKAYQTQLWSKLSDAFDDEHADLPACSHRFRFATAGLLAVVLMTTMGTGVYAYESPDVVEGHVLHPFKAGIENMEERFARSPEARAAFHAKMMSRRLSEGERNFPKYSKDVEASLEKAAVHLEKSVTQIETVEKEKDSRVELIDALSIKNARYEELVARVLEREEDVGDFPSLQKRIEGKGLSEEEKSKLFEIKRGAREMESKKLEFSK